MTLSKDNFILDTMSREENLYIKTPGIKTLAPQVSDKELTMDLLTLYRVDEITFDDKSPRKEALENVISSMCIEGINFVYVIIGDRNGVKFYFGASGDLCNDRHDIAVNDIGEMILKPSLQGNFRGSLITELNADEKKDVIKTLDKMEKARILEGVPGINKDDEKFQSVDRVIDVMLGEPFALMLIAKPVPGKDISVIQDRMYRLYNDIAPLSRSSVQQSSGTSTGRSEAVTKGSSDTSGYSSSRSVQEGKSSSTSAQTGESSSSTAQSGTSRSVTDQRGLSSNVTEQIGSNFSDGVSKSTSRSSVHSSGSRYSEEGSESSSHSKGTSSGHSESSGSSSSHSDTSGSSTSRSETAGRSSSRTESYGYSSSSSDTSGSSTSATISSSDTSTTQEGENLGCAATVEIFNKKVQDWIKYMDDVVFPRLDYGLGKGLFITSTVLLADHNASLIKLENTLRSVYGGESGNRMPLRAFDINSRETGSLKKMQIPVINYSSCLTDDEVGVRTACSQLFLANDSVMLGNWMSSREMSLIAGLPQKEVVGLSLREEVEFGLNIVNSPDVSSIEMGHLVQSGIVFDGKNGVPDISVNYDKRYFDKHIFVTGVTGSGKTTTCQNLIMESHRKFMVIEPAKTEYRILAENDVSDLLVFTLGKENGAPFRLNPFEFFKGENISSRVDMIMASLTAAFDMEAAIPQLFEAAIYECYEDKGWDISTNNNYLFTDPFDDGVFSFPTLENLDEKLESVINKQHFGERLRDEYLGSMKARLKGLLVGAKGAMLNTPRSVDFVELLNRNVVFELEYVKSAAEKSLVMGFILTNLSEAIKVKYAQNGKKAIEHITLIEEAHRLLSKYMPGDSLNKKQGVEMFSDMLAEVRKYGESLIIADQIPNKLTPEVLKNTNTKIVHRIFAQDDKEAIGNTMALKDEQKEHLSYLECGRAVVMMPGLARAVQVQMIKTDRNDTSRSPNDDGQLRERIIDYYGSIYKKGVLPGLEQLSERPDSELVRIYLEYPGILCGYCQCVHFRNISPRFANTLKIIKNKGCFQQFVELICKYCHIKECLDKYPDITGSIEKMLEGILRDGVNYSFNNYREYNNINDSLIGKNYNRR